MNLIMSETSTIIKATKYRWTICGRVFMATTINYLDRQVLSLTWKDFIAPDFHCTNNDYGNITALFSIFYAVSLLFAGRFVDIMDTKKGFLWAIGIWSVGACLHAFAGIATSGYITGEWFVGFEGAKEIISTINDTGLVISISVTLFIFARFVLALGEAGNFPAAIKTTAEYFPKKDRAFATGLFNAATSIGAIAAPFVVGWIVHEDGKNWQIPFLLTGVLSAIWVFLWFRMYKKPEVHPKVTKEELAYITSDSTIENEDKLPWKSVLNKRETWAFGLAKVTDAVWWFYLFWGAKFLADTFDVNIKNIALPFFVIYILADAGSIFGGYLSGALMNKGWTLNNEITFL